MRTDLSSYGRGLATGTEFGKNTETIRILSAIDEQIRDTEDNPLYDGKERHLVLSTLRRVRRLVNAVD